MKTQGVRLLDVLALGPFMVWAAGKRSIPGWARTALAMAGVGTILYNLRNYQRAKEKAQT